MYRASVVDNSHARNILFKYVTIMYKQSHWHMNEFKKILCNIYTHYNIVGCKLNVLSESCNFTLERKRRVCTSENFLVLSNECKNKYL